MGIKIIANKAIGCATPPLNFSVGEGSAVSFDSDAEFKTFAGEVKAEDYRAATDVDAAKIAALLPPAPPVPVVEPKDEKAKAGK